MHKVRKKRVCKAQQKEIKFLQRFCWEKRKSVKRKCFWFQFPPDFSYEI